MKLRKYFLWLIIMHLFVLPTNAQSFEISGKVKDNLDDPIPLANVILSLAADSTFVKGTATDDQGNFILEDLARKRYLLYASYIGVTSDTVLVDLEKDTNLGALIISNTTQELDEVEVVLQQPILEQKIDRHVFKVQNTALTDSDIWDLLSKTPSVLVQNESLTINGQGSVGILINGRRVNLPESDINNLLSGTSASNVEAVEVITNPPAKYSAEGGMLINIIMKKNLIAGYNGALFNRYRQGVYAKHAIGTDHFFKGNKSDFSINYSFGKDKNIRRHDDYVNFFEGDNSVSTWISRQDYLRRVERHGLNLFYDYQFNKKSRLSLSTLNSWNPNNNRMFDTETTIQGDNEVDFVGFNTINASGENTLNTSYYADYVNELNKDKEISIGLHYTFYQRQRNQELNNDFLDDNGNILSTNSLSVNSNNNIGLYSAQVDFKTSLKTMNLETGIRYAGITSESTNEQNAIGADQIPIELIATGKFDYDESIIAAYVGLDGQKDDWTYKGGLRAEYTKTLGIFDSDMPDVKNDYFKLFPSFSIQYAPDSNHNYKLWYYRRITRPRFVIANPFQYFQTNNSVFENNPNILPSTRHYVAAAYTFAKFYTFEIFCRIQKNPIREQVLQDNESKALFFKPVNFIDNITYGFDFSLNKNFTNFWRTYAYLSIHERTFRFFDEASNSILKNGRWTWTLQLNNSLTLLQDKSLFADVGFYYNSKSVIGNFEYGSWSRLSVSLRKSIWNKKGSISLGMEDIFNQRNALAVRQYSDQDNFSDYRYESRLLTFGLRYRFGNIGIKDNKKSKRTEERGRL